MHESTQPLVSKGGLGGLVGLMESLRERCARFEAQLEAAPAVLDCPVHGAGRRALDREASWQSAEVVYACGLCEAEAACRRQALRLEAAGIPVDVRHARLTNFETERPEVVAEPGFQGPERFLEAAREFAAGRVRNAFFCGAPGIGKGHLAAALAGAVLERGGRVRWVECARLFAEYHRAYKSDETERVIQGLVRADLLVLDEICLRDLPADGEEILFAIFDGRHKAGRGTLCLGNKPAQETRQWLGDRISDRLRSGGVTFCYGSWKSMRGEAGDGAF